MSLIKSPQDIRKLRIAGTYLAEVLQEAIAHTKNGTVLIELDSFIREAMERRGCKPSFLGYEGYRYSSCLSVNQQVVHGIPDKRTVQEGDVLGIDIGLWYENVCVDHAVTIGIGPITPDAERLLAGTKEALAQAIKSIRPFRRIGAISSTIQTVAQQYGLGIVRGYTGHGVGHHVHEEPEVPNQGSPTDGILLKPGMVLAIEPMLTTGKGEVFTEIDGWGVSTLDNSLAAQFEHTVLITNKGAEVLTQIKQAR